MFSQSAKTKNYKWQNATETIDAFILLNNSASPKGNTASSGGSSGVIHPASMQDVQCEFIASVAAILTSEILNVSSLESLHSSLHVQNILNDMLATIFVFKGSPTI